MRLFKQVVLKKSIEIKTLRVDKILEIAKKHTKEEGENLKNILEKENN